MDARLTGVAACVALLLAACASGAPPDDRGAGDPLAGRIFRMADGAQVSQAAMVVDAAAADFVLIGEHHDNPLHHHLQAGLVAVLQAMDGPPRAVAFEMIPAERQLDIVEYLQERRDADGLGAAVDWDETGWPDWAWYEPIAQAALENDAQIVAADLGKAEKRAAFAQGAQAFRLSFVRRTGLGEAWPRPMVISLRNELRAAHCDQAQGDAVVGMMRVQRARDAMMADRLAATSGRGGGVLIAGNGHVRKDRGVPWYLARLQPGARTVSIGLIEVGDDVVGTASDLPYDYVWFTPAVDRGGDPCEAYDAELQWLRQPG